MKKLFLFGGGILVTAALVSIYLLGLHHGHTGEGLAITKEAIAAESENKVSPVEARPRDTYYPNSETLAPDEMRVIACGTGMPTTRAAQAAATSSCLISAAARQSAYLHFRYPTTISTKSSSDICTPTISGRFTISSLAVP